uniref:3',5'-cyclic-AMP phosphodiesterase n=1 Tax=Thaumasiovibrio occultus TaxID=1891184 RepID=UPI000B35D252|nr:3',5'-cyclic-AMP phosphodiesterase [Thaumasiovibrio occultus]
MQTFSLPVKNDKSVRLLQITDTHLFADESASLLGVRTNLSFRAVLDAVMASQVDFDAVLATGDISQDHSEASYAHFVKDIQCLSRPCFWLPGNHDFKPSMNSVLPTPAIEPCQHLFVGEHWQVILLDSQVQGVPHGELAAEQLAFLDETLKANPQRHTLVSLHHHPLPAGSAWLDQHQLHNPDDFWNVVQQHPSIRGVLFGHIHQEMDQMVKGVRVLATPSTCFQFKPDSTDFGLDNRTPGWRWIELSDDGEIVTRVERLSDPRFLPDFNSAGY